MPLEPGTVLDTQALGFTVEVIATAATTDGAYFEFDAVGAGRGVVAQPHVHERQTERFEVIEGSLRLDMGGVAHHLGPGDTMTVPPGTRHRQRNRRPQPRPHPPRARRGVRGVLHAPRRALAERRLRPLRDAAPARRRGLIRDFPDHRSALLPVGAQRTLSRLLLRG